MNQKQHEADLSADANGDNACVWVDLTPTWGEIGLMFSRLAESAETKALRAMKPEIARAMGLAQAMKEVFPSLTPEQQAAVMRTVELEAAKMMR